MKTTDLIAKVLADEGVTVGFELVGGMITHLVDSINNLGRTKLIPVHHEQAAAFAAGGVARGSNNQQLGVALATSGPGATNLVTGITDCWLDSVPCLFITGQVNTHEMKGDRPVRQQGFQELDIVTIVSSITKYAVQIVDNRDTIHELRKAIDIAKAGRPGPVLVDIPMDIQRAELQEVAASRKTKQPEEQGKNKRDIYRVSESQIVDLKTKIKKSSRPLILLGGGIRNNKYLPNFISKLKSSGIPYVASLRGAETVASYKNYFGMIGAYGRRVANYAVQECDLLIVLGSRLDIRQTGADVLSFAQKAEIVQIDIDEAQLENRIKGNININVDLELFIEKWTERWEEINSPIDWLAELHKVSKITSRDEYSDLKVSPYQLFKVMSKTCEGKLIQFVSDVGNHQMWAAHIIDLDINQQLHNSAGLGSMGFALPTAIGIHYSTKLPIVVISGDGGAQLNIQELDVVAREYLPIFIIVLNNRSLGMVREFQEIYFEGRTSSTYFNNYTCDFVKIANGYNINSGRVSSVGEFEICLKKFLTSKSPFLCEIMMEDSRECRPRLEFGKRLNEQSPELRLEHMGKQS